MAGKTSINNRGVGRSYRAQKSWILPLILIVLYLAHGLMGVRWTESFSLQAGWRTWLRAPWSILSYAFVHEGLWHFTVNLTLVIMVNASGLLRDLEVWGLFLLGVIAGGVLFVAIGEGRLIGASAGITAMIPMTLYRAIKRKHVWILVLVGVVLLDFVTHTQLWNISFSVHLMGYLIGSIYIVVNLLEEREIRAKYASSLVQKANTSGYASLSNEERKIISEVSAE